MIEQTLCAYLSDALSVPAWPEEPQGEKPERYLIVERTGGSLRDHLRRSTVAIQSYGGSLYQAAALHTSVLGAMEGLADLPGVSRAELNSDYNYTDTVRHRYRYQAVYDVTYWEEV